MQTFGRSIANIQEFINIDLGLGPAQARFQDVEINEFEPEEQHEVDQLVQF